MKTSRFGVDIKPELQTLMREVNAELGLVYRAELSEDAFRRAQSRLEKLMREAGDDLDKQSVVQGGFNQLAQARILADSHRNGTRTRRRPR